MHIARAAAPLLGLALVLSACSSGGGATTAPTAAPTAAPATPAPSTATGGLTINLASNALGTILVDGEGKTLYEFTPDTGGTSTCTGDCAGTWPPLTSDAAPTVGTGLTAADFGTTTRDDGSTQITFDGHPLYHFAGDTAAGDTKGQGLRSKWYVVAADGSMVGADTGTGATPAAGTGVTIQLTDSGLGSILTDGDGRTLYEFTADATNTSNCSGQCLDNWPALTTDGAPTLGDGLDAEDFGTITRDDDASTQVTFYGHPLYYFGGDTAAGDTNGQGLSGEWYVVGADGKMIEAAATSYSTRY
jgi:predicted lipoprotein with Yx(FWY)xxD motif